MKSKELIRQLQELDPSGETEICIRNQDIWFLQRLPAYWDGYLQVVERDKNSHPVSLKYVGSGDKIDIHRYETGYLYEFDENFPVDFSELGSTKQYYIDRHEKYKREWKESEEDCSLFFFVRWCEKLTREPSIKKVAEEFHKEHYPKWMKNPPDANPEKGLSPAEQWEKFWMDRIIFEANYNTFEYTIRDSYL